MRIQRGNVRGRPSVPGRVGALVAAILAMAYLAPAAPAAAQTPGAPEARLHELVNRHREAIGCLPLHWHEPSAVVAEGRSADMIARRYFDHVAPDGRTVFDEVAAAGIEAWGSIAENIALTQAGASSVLELWRDSRPHRRSLDNCAFTHQGLGERGGVWTQILLAQPKRTTPSTGVSPPEPASPPR